MGAEGLFKSDEGFYEALLKVVCISELPRSEDYLPEFYKHLVTCFFVDNNNTKSSEADILAGIRETFGRDLNVKEIGSILSRKNAPFVQAEGGYILSSEVYEKLKKEIQEARGLSERFFNSFREYIGSKYIWLTKTEIEFLAEDLRIFITAAVKYHGYDFLELIAPGERERVADAAKIGSELFKYLPERGKEIEEVRELEFVRFLRKADPKIRIFLENLFQSSIIMLSVYSDVDITPYLKSVLAGGELFLDTNIIYCLVGLNLPDIKEDYENIVRLSKELGFSICINELTIEEYETSIKKSLAGLKSFGELDKNLADALSDIKGDINPDLDYYDVFKTGRWVRPETFIAYYSDLGVLLKELGIKYVITNAAEEIKKESFKTEVGRLINYYRSEGYEERVLSKEFEVFQHDAYAKYYIERKRRKTTKFTDVKYWFLTRDRGLANYAKSSARHARGLPFCVLIGNWARLLKPYAKTEEDAGLFFDLFFSEYFQVYRPFNTQTVLNIFRFVNNIRNLSSSTKRELVMKSILDSSFSREFENAQSDEEKIVVIEKKLGEINDSLARKMVAKEEEAEELVRTIGTQAEKISASEIRIKALESVYVDLVKEKATLTSEIGRLKYELENSRVDRDVVFEDVKKDVVKSVYWGFAKFVLIALGILLGLIFGFISFQPFFDLPVGWRILFGLLGGFSPSIGFWFTGYFKVAITIMAVLGFAITILQLVLSTD